MRPKPRFPSPFALTLQTSLEQRWRRRCADTRLDKAQVARTFRCITRKIPRPRNHQQPRPVASTGFQERRCVVGSAVSWCIWFKGNFGCQSHTTSHLYHSSLARSRASHKYPIHSNSITHSVQRRDASTSGYRETGYFDDWSTNFSFNH